MPAPGNEANMYIYNLVFWYSFQIIEFSFDKSSEFQPSDGSNLFNSAEQVQLLFHAIQETPYNTVSIIKVTIVITRVVVIKYLFFQALY